MKRIPPVPVDIPFMDDELANRAARRNPKVYNGKYNPVELKEWIWGMEKIFAAVEVPGDKKLTLEHFI